MGLETPRLDDRSFEDLVEEARRRIPLYTPEWTDHNLSDPGITLLELMAWMSDIILYRLNRVPDKHFVKFMELIGMRLHEPEAARVPVTFWLAAPQPIPVIIPEGTEVSTTRTESDPAIIFSTDAMMEIHSPVLSHLMTSGGVGGGDGRAFQTYNVDEATEGKAAVKVFASAPPEPGDALYLGFQQNLSSHILGIELQLAAAQGAGIDPYNPPYVWEALSADQSWVKLETDYDSTLGLNSSGLVRLHLPKLRSAMRNEITAFWVRCRLAPPEGARSYEVSPTIHRLLVTSWGATIECSNVTRGRNEVIGRSDGTPGQRFYLHHTPVVPRVLNEYLIVRSSSGIEERWTEVADFASSAPHDRHYTLDPINGEIRLGPALRQRDGTIARYGEIPPKDSMLVMRSYRYGGGQQGNVTTNTINVLKTTIPYISRVTNRVPATGGMDAEALENSKLRVPGYLRSLQRAVTSTDFEYLAQEAAPSQIGRVYCLQPPQTSRGEVKLLVIPTVPRMQAFIAPESLNLPNELRQHLLDYLDQRRLVSTVLTVSTPAFHWVQTEIRIKVQQHIAVEDVRSAVETKLFTFLNPLIGGTNGKGWQFGRDLSVADIMAVLMMVPGVDFVRSVKLYTVNHLPNGQFERGEEVQEIAVVTHGVIASYRHDIRTD